VYTGRQSRYNRPILTKLLDTGSWKPGTKDAARVTSHAHVATIFHATLLLKDRPSYNVLRVSWMSRTVVVVFTVLEPYSTLSPLWRHYRLASFVCLLPLLSAIVCPVDASKRNWTRCKLVASNIPAPCKTFNISG